MTDIQTCTAMVAEDPNSHTPTSGGGYITTDMPLFKRPCGELVVELGPCFWKYLFDTTTTGEELWVHCEIGIEAGHEKFANHTYQGRLVHVTIGPCGECGGEEINHPPNKIQPGYEWADHPYVPIVTELEFDHEAEID